MALRLLFTILMTSVLALGVVACGDDGDTDTPEDVTDAIDVADGDDSGDDGEDGGGDTDTDDSGTDSESVPHAEVTIGGETYVFQHEGFGASFNCRPNDPAGVFRALLLLVDESGELTSRSDLDLALSHDGAGAEENSIRLRLAHLDEAGTLNYTPGWYADADYAENSTGLEPGTSQVDSYVIDGNSVSGTATFVDNESDAAFFRGEVDSVEPVQGTFTVTCPD